MNVTLGQAVRSFFEDHLPVQKGLRPSSIRSYRDGLRLFLSFLSVERRRPITRLGVEDLTMEGALAFLKHLEQERGNHIRTRNQRLAALRTFFTYLAIRIPLGVRQDVTERIIAGIPMQPLRSIKEE